ncbi:MAG: retroviral-like aspartic protease family protein [Myxococcaceae bacterium]|nr:retroviral-like aspartic protease family protein [Myxococcaceae bacterium]
MTCLSCATFSSAAKDDNAVTLIRQIREAARTRDVEKLEALITTCADDAKLTAELGRSLYWAAGLREAKALLRVTCHDTRLSSESHERSGACALLAFDAMADGKPLNQLRAGGRGPFLDKQKLFIAMVAVNGNPAEPFIVDTGAPMTVISKRYADRVKLPYRTDVADRSTDAAGNSVVLNPILLQTLKWGEVELETAPAWVLELPENFKVGGILSPQDVLRGTAFEFDGPARAIQTHGVQDVPTWSKATGVPTHLATLQWNGGNFYVFTQAADLPALPFLLDSGAGGNGVCAEPLAKRGKTLDGGTVVSSSTAAGSNQVRTGLEGNFQVEAEPTRQSTLFVSACPQDADSVIQKSGYVGAPWFWSRRVFFPVERRTIAFTVPVAP